MPAISAFLELMPCGAARSRHDDNYVKPFRILDIYSADGTHDIYRIMVCRQYLNLENINASAWIRYEGNIKPSDAADDLHEDLDSYYMEPLIDKQPWTKTGLYSWKGEEGLDPFWSIVLDLFQSWTPQARNLIRALQIHVSPFQDDDVQSFNHGSAAANWMQYLNRLQVIGVTYWGQLEGAETKARTAAIKFGEEVAQQSHLLLIVEGDAPAFDSDYKYSVKKAMMRIVSSVGLIGMGELIDTQVNKDGLEVLNDRFKNEIAYRSATIASLERSKRGETPDGSSETITGTSPELEKSLY